ncbi:flagellar hook-basal body complex protein FliE [Vibrio sp. Of14-4]|uniref:flagellar hook-basal body complex protein FliE n=1 Tax=Vibrio sp. Of14-4 TaxID=2724878 RepID=UPI001EF33C24|nr:flagellar hook-basal body complex protein FliE [Vibrio sp. Of14-4]MCG7489150.1 flagellar hook-basal body complex protein FliE [Vibrio sp. Of14-4]
MKVEKIGFEELPKLGSVDLNLQPGNVSFSDRLNRIDDTISALAKGEQVDLHTLLIDMEKAKLTLEYTVAMRDKLVDAYKEITRMQV